MNNQKNLNNQITKVETKAKQGDANAQYNLGEFYENGYGVEKDYEKAAYWFQKSAEQGNVHAQDKLENSAELIRWVYEKLAEQGNANAQYNLGNCYANGVGIEKDNEKAVYWFLKSAEQGNVFAQNKLEDSRYNLGYYYAKGVGVEKDYKKAVYWFQKSAEQGNADAQYNLGSCYANGIGVEKNFRKSFSLYHTAAIQGNKNAQNSLAYCYEHGEGVLKDLGHAAYWYIKSKENINNSESKENINNDIKMANVNSNTDAKNSLIITQNIVYAGKSIKGAVNAILVLTICAIIGVFIIANSRDAEYIKTAYIFLVLISLICNILMLVHLYTAGDKLENSINNK